jgi:hypothetical protein
MAFNRPMGETPEEPPYLWAWLSSQANQGIAMACAVGGVVLSFPMGLLGVGLAAVAFIAAEALTAIYVPSMGTFRARIDQAEKARRRDKVAADLTAEINRRCAEDSREAPNWEVYRHMRTRIQFLHDMARNRDVPLTEGDMDRMEDACLDFLGLWLASLSMDDRARTVDHDGIQARLDALDAQAQESLSKADLAQIDKARSDLQEILRRRTRLGARKSAVEAKILSIPDTLEEIYHTVITAPTSGSQADRLQEAINRLHVEEDLEATLNSELGDSPPPRRPALAASAATAPAAAAARAAQRATGPRQ